MEINNAIIETAPRDAATVIILRDAPGAGLQVFMVQRHGASDVLGGAYVFPGGKLDDSDMQLDAYKHLDQDTAQLQAALAEPALTAPQAQGLFVAALREAFEECGVLFAQHASQDANHQLTGYLTQHQGAGFNAGLSALSLRLQTTALRPWSRWIAPKMPSFAKKRFDTRFFVAALPEDQEAQHDNVETTASIWLTPREALERYWARSIDMAPPQIMTLSHLSRYTDVASVLQAAASKPPALIAPEPFDDNGARIICYPGDARHSITTAAMPGPSRLRHSDGRFEPEGGFTAFFA